MGYYWLLRKCGKLSQIQVSSVRFRNVDEVNEGRKMKMRGNVKQSRTEEVKKTAKFSVFEDNKQFTIYILTC